MPPLPIYQKGRACFYVVHEFQGGLGVETEVGEVSCPVEGVGGGPDHGSIIPTEAEGRVVEFHFRVPAPDGLFQALA